MELFVRERGEGEPVVFLHGLFGSADNLGMIARPVSEAGYHCISIDLRNHGRSPHTPGMAYEDMARDVIEALDRMQVEKAHFYGHSMGGKTAMTLALNHGERVKSLCVGDIAPVAYGHNHDNVIGAMLAVRDQAVQDRKEAEAIVASHVVEPDVRTFVMTNWRREDDGKFAWRIGLDEIIADYPSIMTGQDGKPFAGPVLFIKGGDSPYITSEYRDRILKLFPSAQVRIIENTGHWFHAEKPDMTVRVFLRFLEAARAT